MELSVGLRWAVEACRSAEPGPAAAFVDGALFDPADLGGFIPEPALIDLCDNNLVHLIDSEARFAYRCTNHNNLVSVMPADQQIDGDFVHLNHDTFWLLQLAWQYGSPGDFAVELGAGNAIVAAHLVARYRHVLATDLVGPWLHFAQLTLAANAARDRSGTVVACDVADALRPGSFDLVAANSPWSPAVPVDERGHELTFMAGGATGTELPERFLRQGAALLRPGGTAIVLCFDPIFEDGSQPLMPILESIGSNGYDIECIDSDVYPEDEVTTKLRKRRLPTLKRGRHIAAIIRRPQ